MKPLTSEWIDKAEEDFRVATWISREPVGSPSAVCFHCQQCAEKYLKAILTEHQVAFPRTHDLDVLLDLVPRDTPSVEASRDDLKFLAPFSVEARYPGVSAAPEDAVEALRVADLFRGTARRLFGLGQT